MAGYNPEFPIPLNPWNTSRWSGASSSGSGVVTAAGLCYGSLGSDTGGIHPVSGGSLRHGGNQTHLGSGQPLRSSGLG